MLSSNTSAVSGDTVYVEDVFSTYLYTGNGSSQTITNGIDLSTKGGLVWNKNRTTAGYDHVLFDTLTSGTGASTKWLNSNTTNSFGSNTGNLLSSYNTTGFTFSGTGGGNANNSGEAAVSWTFRKQPKFFDVVTYTGNGAAGRSIAHSLGSVPGCIMIKNTSAVSDWTVYHRSTGNTNYLALNATDGSTAGSFWGGTTPTATNFTVSTSGGHQVNWNGENYVAYIFAHDAGGFGLTGIDNVISCGSFTTSGTSDPNATITLGYEPQFVMFKKTNSTGNWEMLDNMRGWPAGQNNGSGTSQVLRANSSAAEFPFAVAHPTATGFTMDTGNTGDTYIYIAIRRGPMKVPTDGTKVFAPVAFTGTNTTTVINAGFPIDMAWIKARNTNATIGGDGYDFDRLRGQNGRLLLNATSAEDTTWGAPYDSLDNMTGFGSDGSFFNNSAINYSDWFFRRAPSFFDEVCYTGTGGANVVLNHNLGAAPELIITKRRDGVTNWLIQNTSLTTGNIVMFTTAAQFADVSARIEQATSTTFKVNGGTNVSAATYVAYLFATCAGVSKVGSYTGTGTTKQVDCGFAAGARFVLIKRTDSTGDWYVWDTARGIVSGNDPYLLLNSTAAETTTTDYIDPYSAGFELSSTAPAALNASGGTYIFLAIA